MKRETVFKSMIEAVNKGIKGAYLPIAQYMSIPQLMKDFQINGIKVKVDVIDNRKIVFTRIN